MAERKPALARALALGCALLLLGDAALAARDEGKQRGGNRAQQDERRQEQRRPERKEDRRSQDSPRPYEPAATQRQAQAERQQQPEREPRANASRGATGGNDRQRIERREQQFRALPREQQQRVRQAEQQYRSMQPQQREELRRKWDNMSEADRERYRQRIREQN